MKLKTVAFLASMFFIGVSRAGPNEWIDYGKIISIVEDAGGLYLYTDKAGTGTAGIEACGGNRLYVATTDVDRLRSLIYMAYAKGDNAYVYTLECKTQWGSSFTQIRALHVK